MKVFTHIRKAGCIGNVSYAKWCPYVCFRCGSIRRVLIGRSERKNEFRAKCVGCGIKMLFPGRGWRFR